MFTPQGAPQAEDQEDEGHRQYTLGLDDVQKRQDQGDHSRQSTCHDIPIKAQPALHSERPYKAQHWGYQQYHLWYAALYCAHGHGANDTNKVHSDLPSDRTSATTLKSGTFLKQFKVLSGSRNNFEGLPLANPATFLEPYP